MLHDEDPKNFFSAERSFLAWQRTAIAVMALGFVVARFGLFLHVLARGEDHNHTLSVAIGVVLVALGAGTASAATLQFRRYRRSLPLENLPAHYWTGMCETFGVILALVAMTLAVYLAA